MRKTIEKRKLQLKRERIRAIGSVELGLVDGGALTFRTLIGPFCNTLSQIEESCCGC